MGKGERPGAAAFKSSGAQLADALLQIRVQRRGQGRGLDEVAVEAPLTIKVGARPWITLMRTPGQEAELIAGLLRSEAIVHTPHEILSIAPCSQLDDPEHDGHVFLVELAQAAHHRLASRRRSQISASSCGLCGKEQIESALTQFPASDAPSVCVSAAWLAMLPQSLGKVQPQFARTGAVHAAGLCEPQGQLVHAFEDVGRHNAVDKVLGAHFLASASSGQWLVVSGRVSFEIVQKAAMHACAGIVAVSAPTSLAVQLSMRAKLSLVGFTRNDSFVVYHDAHGITDLA